MYRCSDDDLKGMNYVEAVSLLESRGFTNVFAREDGKNIF